MYKARHMPINFYLSCPNAIKMYHYVLDAVGVTANAIFQLFLLHLKTKSQASLQFSLLSSLLPKQTVKHANWLI